MATNRLHYGDNLGVMREHIASESVDLVYLDPPFNSNRTYNVLLSRSGYTDAAQIQAFDDTWRWTPVTEEQYANLLAGEAPARVADALTAFRTLVGENDMLAYLVNMAPRLVELRRILKPTGTLYLHCDPTASHYLKVLMDAVFAPTNFRNEIIWCYAGGGIPRADLPRKHDVILRYTAGNRYYYQPVFRPYSEGTQRRGRTQVKGKYFKAGLRTEGTPVNDWWTDVPKITSPTDPEKLGYPTQKPVALLRRILSLSSREGDMILDPFCGCGTTIDAAEGMERHWIGIDVTHIAVDLTEKRLRHTYGDGITRTYDVLGI